jgi:hypothetical protein
MDQNYTSLSSSTALLSSSLTVALPKIRAKNRCKLAVFREIVGVQKTIYLLSETTEKNYHL